MTAVALRRHGAVWQVTRGGQRWVPPVTVRPCILGGWLVSQGDTPGADGLETLGKVRAWCASDDGQAWLDSRPGGAA